MRMDMRRSNPPALPAGGSSSVAPLCDDEVACTGAKRISCKRGSDNCGCHDLVAQGLAWILEGGELGEKSAPHSIRVKQNLARQPFLELRKGAFELREWRALAKERLQIQPPRFQ